MEPPPPFEILEPTTASPVLVEVPHAGLYVDAESLAWMAAPGSSLARDADLYVHELFQDAPAEGATLLFATYSRYVVDLNRAEDDYDGGAVAGGSGRSRPRGVVWRLTSDGAPALHQPVSREEYERRCRLFHQPYHQAIRTLLEHKRERFGFAMMLCAHSMPTPRTSRHGPGPELIPGTRGRTSAAARWIDLVDEQGREQNWHVQHDVPYRGGFSTAHYGRPANGIHVVQVELARRLYMDEQRMCQDVSGFRAVRAFASRLVARLVEEAARPRRP